jgi:hypothetical protein
MVSTQVQRESLTRVHIKWLLGLSLSAPIKNAKRCARAISRAFAESNMPRPISGTFFRRASSR